MLSRRAFTLVELLVVIAIVALLMSILLPSLASARDAARTTKCGASLKQLATAAVARAADRRGEYCTGPFDNRTLSGPGPLEEKGWVADFNVGGYCRPSDALCPSNPAQTSQNLSLARTTPGHRSYTAADIERLIDEGFNTNYCQSWFMAHTATKTPSPAGSPDPKQMQFTLGGLRDSRISAAVPVAQVPLFGDGTVYKLEDTVQHHGQTLSGAKALTDGPNIGRVPLAGGIVWGRQNYTDFGPVHGKGAHIPGLGHDRVYGQMSFADGHVDGFSDTKHDGEFGGQSVSRPDGITTEVYDELEGRVYGGWLTRSGLNF